MAPKIKTALEPYLEAAIPAFQAASQALDTAWPYAEAAWPYIVKAWKLIEPHTQTWAPIWFGMVLIFFGGSLPLTIAAVEAFRLCGW